MTMLCSHCAFACEPLLVWQRFTNGTLHIRAMCSRSECGRFIRYVEQTPTNLAKAGDPPPAKNTDTTPSLFGD